jgi:hypothetical protein
MSIIKDYEARNNHRNVLLNFINNRFDLEKETYAFHPQIEVYLFSNKGNVKNSITGQVLKQQVNSNGYLGVNVIFNKRGRRFAFVHRLCMETFLSYTGYDNYFYEVNHIDGNKQNNDIRNLEWLTRQENLEHARINRLTKKAMDVKVGLQKILDSDIIDMKELYNLGYSSADIAKSYNISPTYCGKIVNNKARIL